MYTVEWLEQKSLRELKAIACDCQIVPIGDRRCRQTWIDALVGTLSPLLAALAVIQEDFSGVDRALESSDGWNPADFGEVAHKADADGQLNLFEWDIDEPPDPDDFESFNDFWVAWNCAILSTVSRFNCHLDDVECDRLLVEILPSEDVEYCPCGAIPAAQCDGTTATHIYPDRIVFTPCYQKLDFAQAELVCDRVGARSPPGGDIYT